MSYALDLNVPYRDGDGLDGYAGERCRLDVYHPVDRTGVPTVIWIHGGGLREQEKFIPPELKEQGIIVVAAGYRLEPLVQAPVYIEDVAAAVGWVFDHIETYGGTPDLVFISGHSAGCYLGDLVALDRHYLADVGHDADRIAGVISLSGHKINHHAIRENRGLAVYRGEADVLSPLYHVRSDAPPMLLVTGDRELELWGRYEENAFFWRMMKTAGHPDIDLHEIAGTDHGGMLPGAYPLLLDFVRRISDKRTTLSQQETAQ